MSVECSTSKKLLGILRSLNQMTSTVLALSVRYSYEKSGIWMVVQISFKGFSRNLRFWSWAGTIGLVVFHVAYGDDQSLIVAMRKLLLALFLVGQKVKFAHHFLATILQGPKARLDFEDLLRLLHDSPDGLVGRLGRP